jgi:O-antigen biosynthesis protein
MPNIPVVFLIHSEYLELKSPGPVWHGETDALDVRWFLDDRGIAKKIAEIRPNVIVTVGDLDRFPELHQMSYEYRRRWIHHPASASAEEIGASAYYCYKQNLFKPSTEPLVSVVTAAYNTGTRLLRPLQALLAQTNKNWEWVIVNDSDDIGQSRRIEKVIENANDPRITLIKTQRHSGVIGEVKRFGFMAAKGKYLVELDHDDELTPNCLSDIVSAFRQYPSAGFVSTDFAEKFEGHPDSEPRYVQYPEGWAFGYGQYYREGPHLVAKTANINPKTIRHIVSIPNHARAWERDTYHRIGGHNHEMHVCDDYELIVRTFLNTRMAHVPRLGYIQYRNTVGNTHIDRNADIQRLVRVVRDHYDSRIHDRLEELGIEDYLWRPGMHTLFPSEVPNPEIEKHCTLISN